MRHAMVVNGAGWAPGTRSRPPRRRRRRPSTSRPRRGGRRLQQPGTGSHRYSSSVSPSRRGRRWCCQCQSSCSTQLVVPVDRPCVCRVHARRYGPTRTVSVLVRARMVAVSATTGRLLAVLAALQSRPVWTGPELAAHLDVTVRTVRRDIDRLRQLGYPIDSDTGVDGRLPAGRRRRGVPPLMLDTDEAFALAVLSARAAARCRASATPPSGRSPSWNRCCRRTVASASRAVVHPDPRAAADRRRRRCGAAHHQRRVPSIRRVGRRRYRDRNGRVTERRLLPYRVVSIGRRWYLVARDARLRRLADVARRPDRIGRADRASVLSDRPARRRGVGAAIDQHRALPAPCPSRARLLRSSASPRWCPPASP